MHSTQRERRVGRTAEALSAQKRKAAEGGPSSTVFRRMFWSASVRRAQSGKT